MGEKVQDSVVECEQDAFIPPPQIPFLGLVRTVLYTLPKG